MSLIKLTYSYLKKYASIIFVILILIISYFIFRKKDASFIDEIKKINDIHEKELNDIKNANSQLQSEFDKNKKIYDQQISNIQNKYNNELKKLKDEMQHKSDLIVDQYGNDPDALANRLSQSTGFKVIK